MIGQEKQMTKDEKKKLKDLDKRMNRLGTMMDKLLEMVEVGMEKEPTQKEKDKERLNKKFNPMVLKIPMIRGKFPMLPFKIFPTQPMENPVGSILNLKYVYNNDKEKLKRLLGMDKLLEMVEVGEEKKPTQKEKDRERLNKKFNPNPIVRRAFPKLLAKTLCSVQPMAKAVGQIFDMKFLAQFPTINPYKEKLKRLLGVDNATI